MINLFVKFTFHFLLSNKTNHKGAAETNTATKELGKVSSAQMIDPLPIKSRRLPTIKETFICFQSKSLYPLKMHHPISRNPDAKNRNVPRIKGGKSLSAACTAKYVEPQTR